MNENQIKKLAIKIQASNKKIKIFQLLALKAFDPNFREFSVNDLIIFLFNLVVKESADREIYAVALAQVLTRKQFNFLIQKLIDIEAEKVEKEKNIQLFLRANSWLSALMVQERRCTMYSEKEPHIDQNDKDKSFFEIFVKPLINDLVEIVKKNPHEVMSKKWSSELCEKFSEILLNYYKTVFSQESSALLPDFVLKNANQIYSVLAKSVPKEESLTWDLIKSIAYHREWEREILGKVNGYVILRFLNGLVMDYATSLNLNEKEKAACLTAIQDVLIKPLQNISNHLAKEELPIVNNINEKDSSLLIASERVPLDESEQKEKLSTNNLNEKNISLPQESKEFNLYELSISEVFIRGQENDNEIWKNHLLTILYDIPELYDTPSYRVIDLLSSDLENNTSLLENKEMIDKEKDGEEGEEKIDEKGREAKKEEEIDKKTWANVIRVFLIKACNKPDIAIPNSTIPLCGNETILANIRKHNKKNLKKLIKEVLGPEGFSEEDECKDNQFSKNPLVLAISTSSLAELKDLLKHPQKIDWSISDNAGETLLSIACRVLVGIKKLLRETILEQEHLLMELRASKEIFDLLLCYFSIESQKIIVDEKIFKDSDLTDVNNTIANTLKCVKELEKIKASAKKANLRDAWKYDHKFVLFFLEFLHHYRNEKRSFLEVKKEIQRAFGYNEDGDFSEQFAEKVKISKQGVKKINALFSCYFSQKLPDREERKEEGEKIKIYDKVKSLSLKPFSNPSRYETKMRAVTRPASLRLSNRHSDSSVFFQPRPKPPPKPSSTSKIATDNNSKPENSRVVTPKKFFEI